MGRTAGFCALPRQWRSYLAHKRRLPLAPHFPSISAKPWEEFVIRIRLPPPRRRLLAGAAATAATVAAPAILRAQSGPLKVGVLLPRSGFEAGIGQDCQRGVAIAPAILKSMGMPELAIMDGDTESSVETARARAAKMISDGAQLLVGAFDS